MFLLALLQAPVAPAAVRDTIARIVQERGYQRSLTSTLFSRLWSWFWDLVGRLFREATASRGTYIIALSLLALLVAAAVARAVITARARRLAAGRDSPPATAGEILAQARALAVQGAFAEAAHRLHAAVVTQLADGRHVRLHPSKTVGDYWRELRAGGDPLAAAYLAYSRTYEIVVYGDGRCDAARYARLEQLAEPMLPLVAAPRSTVRAA